MYMKINWSVMKWVIILLAMLMVSWAWFWLGPLPPLPVCVCDQKARAHSFCQLERRMPVFITLWSYISHARVSIVRLASRHRVGLLFRALFAGILNKWRKRKPFAGCFGSTNSYLTILWTFYIYSEICISGLLSTCAFFLVFIYILHHHVHLQYKWTL